MMQPLFRQLFEPESSTYTYLLADPDSKEAVLIDPVLETVERDLKLLSELGLQLKYILDTHVHADHITGAAELRRRTGALAGVAASAHVVCTDLPLEEGQEIGFGRFKIKVIATPGHTNSCLSFLCGNKVFTGDSLMIRANGRTDFQQGSSDALFESITTKLFTLPDGTEIYPGHDYRGQTVSTIGEEKVNNPRINARRTREEFRQIMSDLKLAPPKKIQQALPANLACGQKQEAQMVLQPQNVNGIPEITPEVVSQNLGQVRLIDVRRPDEFIGELAHIKGAELITLGPDLEKFMQSADKSQEIVFVCRSGARSGQATQVSRELGFKATMNLQGGMIRWNQLQLPVER